MKEEKLNKERMGEREKQLHENYISDAAIKLIATPTRGKFLFVTAIVLPANYEMGHIAQGESMSGVKCIKKDMGQKAELDNQIHSLCIPSDIYITSACLTDDR